MIHCTQLYTENSEKLVSSWENAIEYSVFKMLPRFDVRRLNFQHANAYFPYGKKFTYLLKMCYLKDITLCAEWIVSYNGSQNMLS